MKRWNATLIVICLNFCLAQLVNGQPPQSNKPVPPLGPHGGQMVQGDRHQFEVVFSDRSVEVFAFDGLREPVPVQRVHARAVFSSTTDRRTYHYDLFSPARDTTARNRLFLAVDLAKVPPSGVTVGFVLHNLATAPVQFSVPFRRALSAEQLAIFQQRICPVSGKPLGSMGKPPKVALQQGDIYVCCAGCEKPLRKNPKVHLAKLATTAKLPAPPESIKR